MDNTPRFCAHCGKPVQGGQGFCANCGAQQMLVQQSLVNNPVLAQQASQPIVQQVVQPQSQVLPNKPKHKKKIWLWSGFASAAVLIIAITLAIVLNIRGQDRTIMVYMIGSNLESEGAAASLDISEMKKANFDHEHTKVLVYTGGTKKWALDDISAEENAIFEIVDGSLVKVKSDKKSLMTDPNNLIDFVNYAYEYYPADMYDLILWDHGGGPIFGYGQDENSLSGATMGTQVLADALSKTRVVTEGKKFDFVGFDACLMGSLEVAKALSKYSDYMIASEEVEPGNGWNYAFLDDLGVDEKHINNTKELGQSIVDHYIEHYDIDKFDLSLSVVDLGKVSEAIRLADDLFSNVKESINTQNFSQYSRLMTRKRVYGYTGKDSESYDLVDFMDLCNSLRGNYNDEVDKIENAFNDLVIYNKSNMDNTNGLSVYFLNFNKSAANEILKRYKEVSFSDTYYNFLDKYKDFVTGNKIASKSIYKGLKEEQKNGAIEIELPDELRDSYQSGEIIIYRKLDENKFMPVYRSSEVELDGNKLRATSYNLQFVIEITDTSGKVFYGWSAMMEKERNDKYADYVTFGVLYYNDDSSILGFDTKNYEMHIRLPNGSDEAQVRDIRVESDTELASKMSFDPGRIKFINFVVGAYKLFNDAGELDYNMESYGTLYGSEANVEEGDVYKIKLVGLDFDFGDMYSDEFSKLDDYWAEFIVHDTQGDSHRLNLVHINK